MAQKMLLIDDDPSMLSLLKTILKFEGYEVVVPEGQKDLGELIQWIRQEQPALVLLDVHLLDLDGFELLHRLRRDELVKHVPVLVSSGMDYRQRCKQEGANGFLLKPYMPEELLEAISRIVGEPQNQKGGGNGLT